MCVHVSGGKLMSSDSSTSSNFNFYKDLRIDAQNLLVLDVKILLLLCAIVTQL